LLKWPSVTTTGEQIVVSLGPDGMPLGFATETIGAFSRALPAAATPVQPGEP
jgi:hypothetical protein